VHTIANRIVKHAVLTNNRPGSDIVAILALPSRFVWALDVLASLTTTAERPNAMFCTDERR